MPAGITGEEVAERSELARHLQPSTFPAVRAVLLEEVIRDRAPERIVELVRRLPAGREFADVGEAWSALGGGHEHRP